MHTLITYIFGDQPVKYSEEALALGVRQAGLRTLVNNLLEQEGLLETDRVFILDVLERSVAFVRSRTTSGSKPKS